jgi:hypothetical protein
LASACRSRRGRRSKANSRSDASPASPIARALRRGRGREGGREGTALHGSNVMFPRVSRVSERGSSVSKTMQVGGFCVGIGWAVRPCRIRVPPKGAGGQVLPNGSRRRSRRRRRALPAALISPDRPPRRCVRPPSLRP